MIFTKQCSGNSPENPNNDGKILGMLGLARKAGKLGLGFDESISDAKKGKARCVIVSHEISPKTEKELRYHLSNLPTNIIKIPLDFGAAVGKAVKIAAVNDAGFAKKIIELLDCGEQV